MRKSVNIIFISFVVALSILVMFVTVSVQQTYRHSANDPQIQIASDLSNRLTREHFSLPFDTIEMTESQGVFAIFYDGNKKVVSSTGLLNGAVPTIPMGLFGEAKEHGTDVVTWQPQSGVRIALVVDPVKGGGYIAVGRSLKEVEIREGQLYKMAFICWLALMIGSIIGWIWAFRSLQSKPVI